MRLYETEGIALQQSYLGGFVGAFTTDVGALSTYTSLWRYDDFAERERRRAELQADEALAALPREDPAADPHPAEPDPGPDLVLADQVSRSRGRSRSSPAARRGSARRSPTGSRPEGATVVDRRPEPARGRHPGGRRRTRTTCERMVDETVGAARPPRHPVNNAGLYASLAMRPFTEIPLEEWRQVMDVNVASMFLTCRAAVPVMREQGGGKIVNISSGTPFRGVPFLLHYVTSKGAIVAFTRALAKELGQGRDPRQLRRARLHDERRRRGAPRGGREAARRLGRRAHDPARPGAGGRRRRGRLPLHSGRRLRHRARRWSSTAASTSIDPRALPEPHDARNAVAHELDDGSSLAWELLDDGARATRCSRAGRSSGRGLADAARPHRLPAGRHRLPAHAPGPGHPLPALRLDPDRVAAARRTSTGRAEPWFESGPEPVLADRVRDGGDGVRPRAAAAARSGRASGRSATSTPPTRTSPKLQRATVFLEQPITSVDQDRRADPRRPARRPRRRARRSASRARATSPCSTRCTTRRSGSSSPATRPAPRTWRRRTASSPAGRASASSRARPARRTRRSASTPPSRTRRRSSCSSARCRARTSAARRSRSSTTRECSARWRSGSSSVDERRRDLRSWSRARSTRRPRAGRGRSCRAAGGRAARRGGRRDDAAPYEPRRRRRRRRTSTARSSSLARRRAAAARRRRRRLERRRPGAT